MADARTKNRKGKPLWNVEDINAAVEEIKNGASLRSTSSKFNIPRSTLHEHVTGKSKTFKRGVKPTFTEFEENELAELLLTASRRGFPLTPIDVRKAAYDYVEMSQYENHFNNETKLAGRKWLRNFLRRNPKLSIKTPEALSLSRAIGMNREVVSEFYTLLQKTVEENKLIDKAQHIYNMDESGFPLNTRPSKVVSEKGNRDVVQLQNKERGENITVVACCSASGSCVPPMVIYKGIRRKNEFGDGLPPGSIFEMTETGYINEPTFLLWLEHFERNRPPGKCMLILDGHASHCKSIAALDFCLKKDIILLCLPAHCTHRLQPLDKSFFKPLKTAYFSEGKKWMRNNPGRIFTKLQFPLVFSAAWTKSVTIGTAVNGFRACGIYPWNPDAIPDHVFAPSESFLTRHKPCPEPAGIERPSGPGEKNLSPRHVPTVVTQKLSLAVSIPTGHETTSASTSKIPELTDNATSRRREQTGVSITPNQNTTTISSSPSRHFPPVASPSKLLTPRKKSPRKRTFRSVVLIPEIDSPEKRKKTGQKATVLTSPHYRSELFSAKQSKAKPKSALGCQKRKKMINSAALKITNETLKKSTNETCLCGFCGIDYFADCSSQMGAWIRCGMCLTWFHEFCVGAEGKTTFTCGKCTIKAIGN